MNVVRNFYIRNREYLIDNLRESETWCYREWEQIRAPLAGGGFLSASGEVILRIIKCISLILPTLGGFLFNILPSLGDFLFNIRSQELINLSRSNLNIENAPRNLRQFPLL